MPNINNNTYTKKNINNITLWLTNATVVEHGLDYTKVNISPKNDVWLMIEPKFSECRNLEW